MSLRTFGARLCSRAGAGSAAFAHAPPRLRDHLSGAAAGPLQQLKPLLRTSELQEAARGMEKVLGIGADAIELLHQRSGGAFTKGDPVRIVRGKYAGQCGTLVGLDWRPRRPGIGSIELIGGRRVFVSERDFDDIDAVSSWRGIKRGKDLFVTGLQNFDIPAAYDGLHALAEQALHDTGLLYRSSPTTAVPCIGPATASRLAEAGVSTLGGLASLQGDAIDRVLASTSRLSRERLVSLSQAADFLRVPSSSKLGLWIFSVHALQAFGHFPALARDNPRALRHVEAILAGPTESPQRRHLITHSKWWDYGENANALDELVAPGSDWPEGGETLQPRTLLRRLREAAELRRLGPDVRFSHLDAIEDPPTDGDASLRVLRSSHEIERVGKALRNCAGSYIHRVKRGDYALVALYKGDKVEALAGYARGGRSWDHRPVASGNRNTSAQVQARFDTFLPTLRDEFNRESGTAMTTMTTRTRSVLTACLTHEEGRWSCSRRVSSRGRRGSLSLHGMV